MPPASSRPNLGVATAVTGLAALCLGLGWWLGQLSQGEGVDAARPGQEQPHPHAQEAAELQQQLENGTATAAQQQRLLELLVAVERREEALPLLERLADREPERWELRLLLAELRRQQNDRPGAERDVRQVLNRWPNQVEALQLMALLQLEGGRGDQAETQLTAALQRTTAPTLQEEALPIGLVLAQVQQRRRGPAAAEATLIRLATNFPNDPRPLLARALLQQEQGQQAQAAATLAEARRLESDPQQQARLDEVAAAWGLQTLREPSPAPNPPPAGR